MKSCQRMMDRCFRTFDGGGFVCVKDAGLEEYVYTVVKLLYTVVQVLCSFKTLMLEFVCVKDAGLLE